MPRVLIETGFISNTVEGNRLNSEEGQNEVATAIAGAILSYKREYFGADNFLEVGELPSQKAVEKEAETKAIAVAEKVMSQANEKLEQKNPSTTAKVVFKVQLLATQKSLQLDPKNFKGLNNVSFAFENNFYKYMYGETSKYEEAKQFLQEAKSKGYYTAYLIAFKDGQKINIQDVIK
jgi:N-acetylmuramoyl-L-alanine amidase